MAEHGSYWRYFSPEAIDRIVEAGGDLPEPLDDDTRSPAVRRPELEAALEFAADRLVTTVFARHVYPPKARAPGRPIAEIQSFVEALLGIWLDLFDGRFRTSVDGTSIEEADAATGHLVRFLEACFDALRERLQPGGQVIAFEGSTRPAAQAALVKALGASRAALRARVRRSGWKKLVQELANRLNRGAPGGS